MPDRIVDIPRYKTHRATARNIYNYLRLHPEDLPSDSRDRSTPHHALVFRIGDSENAVQITELTHSAFAASPAIVGEIYTSTGDYIGHSAILLSHNITDEDHADEAVKRLRLVVMRIDRYQAKKKLRQAAYEATYA